MDAKAELSKVLKDLSASAREFAAYGLTTGQKALSVTGATLKRVEETLKRHADKLAKKDEPAAAPEAAPPAPEAVKQ